MHNPQIPISLDPMQWIEVAAALRRYVNSTSDAKTSQSAALLVLRQIDQIMMGSEELPPADDVL